MKITCDKIYQYFNELLNERKIPHEGDHPSEDHIWEYCKAVALYLWGDKESVQSIRQALPKNSYGAILLNCRDHWQKYGMSAARKYLDGHHNIFSTNDDPFWRAEYLLVSGLIEMSTGNYSQARTMYTESVELHQKMGIYDRYARGLYNLAICQEELGEMAHLEITLLRLESACEEYNLRYVRPLYYQFKVMNLMEHGLYQEALIQNELGLSFLKSDEFRNDEVNLLLLNSQIHIRVGQFEEAKRDLSSIKRLMKVRRGNLHRESVVLIEALLEAQQYRHNEALTLLGSIDYSSLDSFDQLVYTTIKCICFRHDPLYRDTITDIEIEMVRDHLDSARDTEAALKIDLLWLEVYDNQKGERGAQQVSKELNALIALYEEQNLAYPLVKALELELKLSLEQSQRQNTLRALERIIQVTSKHKLTHLESRYSYFMAILRGEEELDLDAKDQGINYWPFTTLTFAKHSNDPIEFDQKQLTLIHNGGVLAKLSKGAMISKLIAKLSSRQTIISNKDLFEYIWEQEYLDREYADKKVYQLISETKNYLLSLGLAENLIQNIPGKGYKSQIKLREGAHKVQKHIGRLSLFINSLKTDQLISSRDLINFYGYESKQANKDLKLLCKEGLIEILNTKRREKMYRVLESSSKGNMAKIA